MGCKDKINGAISTSIELSLSPYGTPSSYERDDKASIWFIT
jgi:hypothetical protein